MGSSFGIIKPRKARKEHTCWACQRPVPVGTVYAEASGMGADDDKPWRLRMHEGCRWSVQADFGLNGTDGWEQIEGMLEYVDDPDGWLSDLRRHDQTGWEGLPLEERIRIELLVREFKEAKHG